MWLVAPSLVAVGEPFALKVKLLTEPYIVGWTAAWRRTAPTPTGPFNRSPREGFDYRDNVPRAWRGSVQFAGGDGYAGPAELSFADGHGPCGADDARPIRRLAGLRFTTPGTKFITATDPASGATATSNPVIVLPAGADAGERLYWGDLHSQSFFTDGLRCPEELCAFARDEGFLDIFAISDHIEALSERQWDYFVAVVNDYNAPGRFATLIGQEWTNHRREVGAPGHRNLYYRGDRGPALRCTDPRFDTLAKLYAAAREQHALVIPHHSANVVMGVDWTKGHDAEHERLVEIHSIWGNSERPASAGNPCPIRTHQGEREGQHVFDALRLGRRFGLVGGGDIHDGRPGDDLHQHLGHANAKLLARQGLMGVWTERLTREAVFDALWARRVYATTNNRTFLRFSLGGQPMGGSVPAAAALPVVIYAASDSPIARLDLVRNGADVHTVTPNAREVQVERRETAATAGAWYLVRVTRQDGGMAWSSPIWVD